MFETRRLRLLGSHPRSPPVVWRFRFQGIHMHWDAPGHLLWYSQKPGQGRSSRVRLSFTQSQALNPKPRISPSGEKLWSRRQKKSV